MVEQKTENLCVSGSNPLLGKLYIIKTFGIKGFEPLHDSIKNYCLSSWLYSMYYFFKGILLLNKIKIFSSNNHDEKIKLTFNLFIKFCFILDN